ncbi:hypothetical protein SLE2022_033370 [Rubroshorea leprosula]
MSAYENVVVGKLRLKGKPLDVKSGGVIKKKKKKHEHRHYSNSAMEESRLSSGGKTGFLTNHPEDDIDENEWGGSRDNAYDDCLTLAERKFLQQTEKLELQRLAKMASRSHRDRIQEFNQYLANVSEHYDIPKVGPG